MAYFNSVKVSKDPQNPYRYGVLVGNYVEDTFGQEIAAKDVSAHFYSARLRSLQQAADLLMDPILPVTSYLT